MPLNLGNQINGIRANAKNDPGEIMTAEALDALVREVDSIHKDLRPIKGLFGDTVYSELGLVDPWLLADGILSRDTMFVDGVIAREAIFADEVVGDSKIYNLNSRKLLFGQAVGTGDLAFIHGTAIQSQTKGNPTLFTTEEPHGLATNDDIIIGGYAGDWAAANDTWTVTVLSPTQFTVPLNSTSFGKPKGVAAFGIPNSPSVKINADGALFHGGGSARVQIDSESIELGSDIEGAAKTVITATATTIDSGVGPVATLGADGFLLNDTGTTSQARLDQTTIYFEDTDPPSRRTSAYRHSKFSATGFAFTVEKEVIIDTTHVTLTGDVCGYGEGGLFVAAEPGGTGSAAMTPGNLYVNGDRVVGPKLAALPASVTAPGGTASNTYDDATRDLINGLTSAISSISSWQSAVANRFSTHGLTA